MNDINLGMQSVQCSVPRIGLKNIGERLGDWSLGLAAFSGAFVIFEPAPYEVFVCGLMVLFFLCGLKINLEALPLLILTTLYSIGGVIGLFQLANPMDAVVYIAVTVFLGLTSWFFALVVAEDSYRLRPIMTGYVAGALATTALGVTAYFGLIPGGELFLRFGRAMGAFQDPNVFAPFIILPLAWLWYGVLSRPHNLAFFRLLGMGVLLLGVLLAFSRAGWGLTLFVLGGVYALVFIDAKNTAKRMQLLALAAVGFVGLLVALAIALQIEAIASVFSARAQLVQDYDAGSLGRFQRHWLGFSLALEKPWGIGRSEFAKLFTEDPHNIWLKNLMVYGWLGFVAFLTLVALTLWRGFSLLFLNRPWKPYLHVLYVVFIGHVIMAYVIDIDHWRHVFLIIGLLWGIFALEARHKRSGALTDGGLSL